MDSSLVASKLKITDQPKNNTSRMQPSEIFNTYDSDSNLKKNLKGPKPRKLVSIASHSSLELNRRISSVTKVKQVTVDSLLSKSEMKATLHTDRSRFDYSSYSLHSKWAQLHTQNSDILSKLNIKKLDTLKNSIDIMKQNIFANLNINEITKLTIFDSIFLVFNHFNDVCLEINNIQISLQNDIVQVKNEILGYKEQINDLQEKLVQRAKTPSPSKNQMVKVNAKATESEKKKNLEKLKMMAKLALLEEHCNQLKSSAKSDEVFKDLERYKKLYEDALAKIEKVKHSKKNMKYRFQLEIGDIKNKALEDSEFKRLYSSKMNECLDKIEYLERENTRLSTGERRWSERLSMLTEDFSRYINFRELYKQNAESLKSFKQKYNQLELELIAGNISRKSESITWVSLQDPIFEKVRIGATFPDSTYLITFQNTSEFHLNSPNFTAFLNITDEQFGFEQQFPNWLEVNIRGIYDSKYYEHLSCSMETGKTPSRFPDFVYTWIGKFCIDEKNRNVSELEWWKRDSLDTLRMKLLCALKLANARKVWELFTFQEFLNEELMLDELAFYLHCRNLLFKGPQLSHTHGKFSNFHYIEREYLNEIVDSIMYKLTGKERLDLKNQLYGRSKPMGKGTGIESGFVIYI